MVLTDNREVIKSEFFDNFLRNHFFRRYVNNLSLIIREELLFFIIQYEKSLKNNSCFFVISSSYGNAIKDLASCTKRLEQFLVQRYENQNY